jgi:5-formyltetrahydrofolate cyclo-ligase
MSKKEIRVLVSGRRDAMPREELAAASRAIGERLFGFEPFSAARTVMFFVSFRSEVLTAAMIKRALAAGKRVAVPIVNPDTRELVPSEIKDFDSELTEGAYGIPEPKAEFVRPVPPAEIDFVAMPGLAFDRRGGRIGYGGGFYDRFAARLRPGALLAALAFSFQVFDEIPALPHDRKVDAIVTEKEIIVFGD